MAHLRTEGTIPLTLDPSGMNSAADDEGVLPLSTSISPGDSAAFEGFYRRFFTPVLRYVYRYVQSHELAEDFAQDAFYQVWRRLATAEPVRDLEAYIYTAARNNALKYLRHRAVERRRLGKPVPPAVLAHGPGVAAQGEQQVASAELAAAIQRALDALPPRQREVIRMKVAAHSTHREIGAALGIDPDTVSVHFTRAVERLRKTLPRLFS